MVKKKKVKKHNDISISQEICFGTWKTDLLKVNLEE